MYRRCVAVNGKAGDLGPHGAFSKKLSHTREHPHHVPPSGARCGTHGAGVDTQQGGGRPGREVRQGDKARETGQAERRKFPIPPRMGSDNYWEHLRKVGKGRIPAPSHGGKGHSANRGGPGAKEAKVATAGSHSSKQWAEAKAKAAVHG